MKKKINIRLIGIAVLAICATVLGTTIIYYNLFQNRVQQDLSVNAKLLKDTHFFESVDENRDKIDLSTDIDELRVTWVDIDGTVLYDNDASAKDLSNHLNRPEIKQALKNGIGKSVRRSDTMNKNTFYYAVLLDNRTILRVATNAQSFASVFMSVAGFILLIILAIISICIVISHLLTVQLLRPIEMMARNLEKADYESPYKELEPFSQMLKTQHIDILSAAKARQDFTANVSHELKTPLTAISGYAELLEEGMIDREHKNHFYQEIRKNADRLLVLINDIIRLSELDQSGAKPQMEELDLYELVMNCADSLIMNGNQREVAVSFEGEACTFLGNVDMLKELVENLVENAIRYNNPGGKVAVKVMLTGERATLVVKDNGIGIPASEQERIFERFYRVDKSRSRASGGTGLGLAIVKHIVEIHDAKLELDSAPGVGTTVTVRF